MNLHSNEPQGDARLIQIVDAALADSARRSGDHLVCRPGCAQCCTGAFAVNALDAERLQKGFADLMNRDPGRAGRVRSRTMAYLDRVAADFPGDPVLGSLDQDPDAQTLFAGFANDEVCPVLDPHTKTCDLYHARPMTCRVFGPPARTEEGFGVCELCYTTASAQEIAECEMVPDPENLEDALLEQQRIARGGNSGETVVAYALVRSPSW